MDITDRTTLSVFYLADPSAPRKVGTVIYIPATRRCGFIYDDGWREAGFALSPDMPLGRIGDRTMILSPQGWSAPGALDDAMPDRWAERTIRILDRPKIVTPLVLLYFAGDRRFGALGISSDPDIYVPYPEGPLITTASMVEANELIQRISSREPLNERERTLVQSSRSLGGAQPKMLVEIDGEEWITKFPRDSNVDLPLVEHATMKLAQACGISVAQSRDHPIGYEHVVKIRRFDRVGGRRLHALSARTMLITAGGESYGAIADVIRAYAAPDTIATQRRELYARMIFNMLIDNTDDHPKNHAFIRREDGFYDLAPAFDIPPQMNGLGDQAIPVVEGVPADSFAAVIGNAARFGLQRDEAVEIWNRVADGVSRWQESFRAANVLASDITALADFIDSDEKVSLRAAGKGSGGTGRRTSGKAER